MASPAVQVKNGAAAYAPTANGNNATPGNTQTIQLISQAGVSSWSISCINTDDLSSAATVTASLTIDNLNKTATFTAPVAGRAYMFQSQINAGINLATGAVDATTSYTFVVYTLTGGGVRVLSANETTEGNATAGWIATVNALIRSPSGNPGGSAAGSLGGSYPSPTVVQVDGAAGNLPILAAQTTWGTSPNSSIISIEPLAPVATTGATLTTVLTFPIPASTVADFSITICGIRTGGVSGAAGDCYRADFPVTYQRIAAAAPSLVGAAAAETGKKSNGGGSAYVGSVAISGNSLVAQVTGVATTNIDWTAVVQGQQVG